MKMVGSPHVMMLVEGEAWFKIPPHHLDWSLPEAFRGYAMAFLEGKLKISSVCFRDSLQSSCVPSHRNGLVMHTTLAGQ